MAKLHSVCVELWTLIVCFGDHLPTSPNLCLWNFKPPRLCGSQPPLPPTPDCFSEIFASSCISSWLLKAFHPLSKVTSSCDTIPRTWAFSDFLVPESRNPFYNSAIHKFSSSKASFLNCFDSCNDAFYTNHNILHSPKNFFSIFQDFCKKLFYTSASTATASSVKLANPRHMSFWSHHSRHNFLCLFGSGFL